MSLKRGRPRSIRRRKSAKRGMRKTFNPKQRAAARARAHVRRRKGR